MSEISKYATITFGGIIFLGLHFCNSALAFECDNVGTAAVAAPDDMGAATATACGDGAIANGTRTTALGSEASSAGFGTAVGDSASAVFGSTALGYLASTGGNNDTALGRGATAVGIRSTAVGYQANAGHSYTTALGHAANAGNIDSTALGRNANATGARSTAVGYRAQVSQLDSIVLGAIPLVNDASEYADVAIGTTAPDAPLHVHRDDGNARILVEETSLDRTRRELLHLKNNGPVELLFDDELFSNDWIARAQGVNFRLYRQNAYAERFELNKNGNLTIGGTVTENSDRNAKQGIEPVNPEQILEKVAALPVAHWQYTDDPGVDHIGPMAQDFHAAFGVGASETGISTLDTSGVALAAIQALNEQNTEKGDLIEQQQSQIRSLEQRVHELEAMVLQIAATTNAVGDFASN